MACHAGSVVPFGYQNKINCLSGIYYGNGGLAIIAGADKVFIEFPDNPGPGFRVEISGQDERQFFGSREPADLRDPQLPVAGIPLGIQMRISKPDLFFGRAASLLQWRPPAVRLLSGSRSAAGGRFLR